MRTALLAAVAALLIPLPAVAETPEAPASQPAREKAHDEPHDNLLVTPHEMTIDGQELRYDATAGTVVMKDDAGKPQANFFFVAYAKKDAEPATRPVTFVFNGGPGAAAVWLHLGALGPQRIALQDDGLPGPPPYRLIDNPQSWLGLSDLVFIDPVGTGFSRPVEGQKAEQFYGVENDINSISEFVRLYLTRYRRWGSPKFLVGESYGTTRVAALSEHLLDRYGISLNGVVMISTLLNFETLAFSDGNDLPYILYLPSYTAIAAHHHKLGDVDLSKLLPEVEHYALNDYALALAQGGAMTRQTHDAVLKRLTLYTGLPAELIDQANLRVDPWLFRQKLLADQRLILGRFDGRVTGYNPNPIRDEDYDPSLSIYLPVYSGAFNEYVRGTLKYESDLTYEALNGHMGRWDWGHNGDGYLDVTGDLRRAMQKNPSLKVLVCNGREDLATPYLATRYTIEHLDPTGHLQANITLTYYDSGHMVYHSMPALEKLKGDVTEFFRSALAKPTAAQD